jgi:hypothetical protein
MFILAKDIYMGIFGFLTQAVEIMTLAVWF